MALELLAASILATVLLPFAIGYWIGNAGLAAAAFVALGVTILIRQVTAHGDAPFGGQLIAWMVISTALSSASAYYGGRARTRVVRPMSD